MTPHPHHGPAGREGWVAALQRFAHSLQRLKCELCGTGVAQARHRHLLDPATRRLLCACEGCALRVPSHHPAALRLVPRQILAPAAFSLDDAQWEALPVPVGVAFFVRRARDGSVAVSYPGPAGATESTLEIGAPGALGSQLPALAGLQPDVEALLINRMGHARACYVVPIDRCYALVGLMRTHWRGFTGGPELRAAVAEFFAELDSLARAAASGALAV